MIQTGLITTDTGIDLIATTLLRFQDKRMQSANIGRAIETISASPDANTYSAISGVLIRFEVIKGIFT